MLSGKAGKARSRSKLRPGTHPACDHTGHSSTVPMLELIMLISCRKQGHTAKQEASLRYNVLGLRVVCWHTNHEIVMESVGVLHRQSQYACVHRDSGTKDCLCTGVIQHRIKSFVVPPERTAGMCIGLQHAAISSVSGNVKVSVPSPQALV